MRCYQCSERVIDFGTWARGFNAFLKVQCPNCGAQLRPHHRLFIVVVILLLSIVPTLVLLHFGLGALGVPTSAIGTIFLCLFIPMAAGVAYWEWHTGFYVVRKDVPISAEISPPKSTRSRVKPLLMIILAVALIAFMLKLGYRDLVLTYDGDYAEGRITNVEQPAPGFLGVSDFHIQYEFEIPSGALYKGEDETPGAFPPPEDGRIDVAYSEHDPSISRIAGLVSSTPIAGILMGGGLLVGSMFQMFRKTHFSQDVADDKMTTEQRKEP